MPCLGIAFTSKMVEPKAAAQNEWFFQKVFGDGDFIAAGQLIIPPKSQKPSKGTKDNTYVSPSFNMTFYLESPINAATGILRHRRRRQPQSP
jgi:hypothetical protein